MLKIEDNLGVEFEKTISISGRCGGKEQTADNKDFVLSWKACRINTNLMPIGNEINL